MTKFNLIASLLLGGLAVFGSAAAVADSGDVESRAYLHGNNIPANGVALEGYCPVAYFLAGKAIRGQSKYQSTHDDVTYYFVDADAKAAFDAEPERYVPLFGGWCATGMALSDKFPVDPTRFKIVDGRLLVFLRNRDVDTLELWNQGDEREQLRRAEAYWTKVQG